MVFTVVRRKEESITTTFEAIAVCHNTLRVDLEEGSNVGGFKVLDTWKSMEHLMAQKM